MRGQAGIARLRDGSVECVENTGILARTGEALQSVVHFLSILFCELSDRAHFQKLKIPEHSGTYGDEIFQGAGIGHVAS